MTQDPLCGCFEFHIYLRVVRNYVKPRNEGGDREQDAGLPHSNEPEESMRVEPSDMDHNERGS